MEDRNQKDDKEAKNLRLFIAVELASSETELDELQLGFLMAICKKDPSIHEVLKCYTDKVVVEG